MQRQERVVDVDGIEVKFAVQQTAPLPGIRQQWILVGSDRGHAVFLAALGEGADPAKTMEEYSEADLRSLWRGRMW